MTDKIPFDEYYENLNNPNESNVKLNNQNPYPNDHDPQPWHMNEASLHRHNEQMLYQNDYIYPEGDGQPPHVPSQEMQHAHLSGNTVQNEQNPDNQAFEHGLTPDPSQYPPAVSPITQEADRFPDDENKMAPQEEEAATHSKAPQSNKKSKKAQNTSKQKSRKAKQLENIFTLEQEKILPHLITTYHTALVSLLKEHDISQENLLFNTKDVDISDYEPEMLLYLHTHMPIVFKISKEKKPTYYELVAGIRWKGMYDHLIYNGVINKNKEFTVAVVTKEKNNDAMNNYIKQHLIWEIHERLKRKEEQPSRKDERTKVSHHLRSVFKALCENLPNN